MPLTTPWTDYKTQCVSTFAGAFVLSFAAEWIFLYKNPDTAHKDVRLKRFWLFLRLLFYVAASILSLIFIVLDWIDFSPGTVESGDTPVRGRSWVAFGFGGFMLYELATSSKHRSIFNYAHHGGAIIALATFPDYYAISFWFVGLNEAPGVVDLYAAGWHNDCAHRRARWILWSILFRTAYIFVSLGGVLIMAFGVAHSDSVDIVGNTTVNTTATGNAVLHGGAAGIQIGGVVLHWTYYVLYMRVQVRRLLKYARIDGELFSRISVSELKTVKHAEAFIAITADRVEHRKLAVDNAAHLFKAGLSKSGRKSSLLINVEPNQQAGDADAFLTQGASGAPTLRQVRLSAL